MLQPSFIRSLRIASVEGDAEFLFATPDQFVDGAAAINVICGENAVGKSYIIRALEGLSSDENRRRLYQSGYEVKFTLGDVLPKVNNIEPWRYLSFSGQMFFDKQGDYSLSKDPKRLVAINFWFELVSSYFKNVKAKAIAKSEWLNDFKFRKALFEQIDADKSIGLMTFFESKFLEQFEQLFDCELGLRKRVRKVHTLEITMDTDFGFFPFQNWSQGQKTVFNFLQTIHYAGCNVFLIDEIENNLHPNRLAGHGIGVSPVSPLRVAEKIQEFASIASISKYFSNHKR